MINSNEIVEEKDKVNGVSSTQNMSRDDGVPNADIVPEKVVQLHPGLRLYAPLNSDVTADCYVSIVGSDFHQMLQVLLKPGQTFTAEPGSMTMMSGELIPEIETAGCDTVCRRCCCASDHMFTLVFENKTNAPQFLALSPPIPGRIIPINLNRYTGISIASASLLGALGRSWSHDIKFLESPGSGCCPGQSMTFTELHGKGTAFIHAMGTVEILQLHPTEEIVLDRMALVAFERSVQCGTRPTGGCLMCCCGGMGTHNLILTGPGMVIVQSLSIERFRWAMGFATPANAAPGHHRDV